MEIVGHDFCYLVARSIHSNHKNYHTNQYIYILYKLYNIHADRSLASSFARAYTFQVWEIEYGEEKMLYYCNERKQLIFFSAFVFIMYVVLMEYQWCFSVTIDTHAISFNWNAILIPINMLLWQCCGVCVRAHRNAIPIDFYWSKSNWLVTNKRKHRAHTYANGN